MSDEEKELGAGQEVVEPGPDETATRAGEQNEVPRWARSEDGLRFRRGAEMNGEDAGLDVAERARGSAESRAFASSHAAIEDQWAADDMVAIARQAGSAAAADRMSRVGRAIRNGIAEGMLDIDRELAPSSALSDAAKVETEQSGLFEAIPVIRQLLATQQRLKFQIPTSRSYLTIGARHREEPIGAGGITARTDATVVLRAGDLVHLESSQDTVLVSHGSLREHVAHDRELAVRGDYRLQSGQDVRITAGGTVAEPSSYEPVGELAGERAPGGGPPAPSEPDVDGPRAGLGKWKAAYGIAWKPYDVRSAWKTGLGALDKVHGKHELPRRMENRERAKRAWDMVKNTWKFYDSGLASAAATFTLMGGKLQKAEPTSLHGNVCVHGAKTVEVTAPWKVSLFSGYVAGLEAMYNVSIKSAFTASLKAWADATVFGGLAAKLESLGFATVTAPAVRLDGQHVEVVAKHGYDADDPTAARKGPPPAVSLTSEGGVAVSASKTVAIKSDEADVQLAAMRCLEGTGQRHVELVGADCASLYLGEDRHHPKAFVAGLNAGLLKGGAPTEESCAQLRVSESQGILIGPSGAARVAVEDGYVELVAGSAELTLDNTTSTIRIAGSKKLEIF